MSRRITPRLPAALQRKWSQLTDRIAEESPSLAAEAEDLLRETVTTTTPRKARRVEYEHIRMPADAIVACLAHRPGVWRGTTDIINEILNGGFRPGEYVHRELLRQAIRNATMPRGRLVRSPDGLLLGLPGWDLPDAEPLKQQSQPQSQS